MQIAEETSDRQAHKPTEDSQQPWYLKENTNTM